MNGITEKNRFVLPSENRVSKVSLEIPKMMVDAKLEKMEACN